MIFERIMLFIFQVALICLLGIVGMVALGGVLRGRDCARINCTAFVVYVIKRTWLQ